MAEHHAIVVCAVGIELDRAPWLVRRELDSFWLCVYDSRLPGVAPRSQTLTKLRTELELLAAARDR